MAVTARLRESWYRLTGRAELAEELRAERRMRVHLEESIADLEARMFEPGWRRLTALADQQFSREGLREITAACRVMAIKNPLIKRGLALRASYVWGQGVQVAARATGQRDRGGRAQQDVNAVVQAFLDDEGNRRAMFSQAAREDLERALGTDGNVFVACFTSPRTGRVQVRVIPWDEITEVISNPEDAGEPWFYRREWWYERRDPTSGGLIQERRTAYYPALGYRPRQRPIRIRDIVGGQSAQVMWDAPTLHVSVNSPLGWRFGIPDAYAAIDWANAYREFLTDWARLMKALSRFAWRLTSKGSKQATAKMRLAQAPATDPITGEPRTAGATAMMTPDMALEAIPKSGATIDSESGRPLAMMVAAALDVPVTMLLGDPGQTGARATAETLDQPTELAMQMRREMWTDVLRTLLAYVVDQAAKAPQGPLRGAVRRDGDGRETVELAGDTDRTIDISWPDLDEQDPAAVIDAVVKADSTTYLPPLVVVRLLLHALGVRDVDEILDELTDEGGEFIPPGLSAGLAAADAFRRGEDPAALLGGIRDEPDEERDGTERNGDQPSDASPDRRAARSGLPAR